MDLDQIVRAIHSLGVSASKTNQVHSSYLNHLEEINHKIQDIINIIQDSGELLSSSELQAYERSMQSLTQKLFEENASTAFKLLKTVEETLQKQKRLCKSPEEIKNNLKLKQLKQIFGNVRRELVRNKGILGEFKEYWDCLYRIMKHEEYIL